MLISRSRNSSARQPEIILNGSPIETVDTFKYLGLLFSSDLTWTAHIQSCSSKSKKLLGMIYRKFYKMLDPPHLLRLYKSLVRPHLEYAAQVWDPHMSTSTTELENIQKFALRICSKQWSHSYSDLLESASIPSLQNRRTFLKLVTLYKFVHGLACFPVDIVVPSHIARNSGFVSARSGHELKLQQQFARTSAFQASFVLSSIAVWNNLPADAVQAPSIASFRKHITSLLL